MVRKNKSLFLTANQLAALKVWNALEKIEDRKIKINSSILKQIGKKWLVWWELPKDLDAKKHIM